MKLVTQRQLIMILIVSMITLKVLSLPSLLATDIGRDSYFFLFFMLILDFLILLVFLFLFNKNPDLSFYEMIKKMFGVVIAKIIMAFFFMFFFLKCWVVFQSNYAYLSENLYTTLRWYVFSFPVLLTIFFIAIYGVNAFARLIEIFFPIIAAGFILSVSVGILRADFSNLLPIFDLGISHGLKNIFPYSFWFGDYIIFIVFFGNIKIGKNFNRKVILSVFISLLFVVLFYAIFYSVYNYNSVGHTNAISNILQTIPYFSDIGSIDWVLIMIWDGALFIFFTLNMLGTFYSFRQTFSFPWQIIAIIILLTGVLISCLVIDFNLQTTFELLTKYFWYFCIFVQYFLPVFIFAFSFRLREKKNVKKAVGK